MLWIGDKSQVELAAELHINFVDRLDFNNLEINYYYEFAEPEREIIEALKKDEILFKMYFRNSYDNIPSRDLCNQITQEYSKAWFYFINKYNLDANVILEMPHLPFTYIGYKIFRSLGLKTLFSSTLQMKDKSYWVQTIEEYPLFENSSNDFLFTGEYDIERQTDFATKLKEQFGIQPSAGKPQGTSFAKSMLIQIRNILFPSKSKERLNFKVIKGGKFRFISNRIYHFRLLKQMIKKYFVLKYYEKNSGEMSNENHKLKILFAMHFEPEMAVYPLAGEKNNQFEIIKELSKKVGNSGKIYVKEHPWVFDSTKYHGIVRGKSFYNELKELGNVDFIPLKTKSSDLFDKITLLATLTGTIGWEAFLEKIPVISFGFPWYGGIPCVQKYTKQLNIMEFQEETRFKFEKIDYEAIYNRLVNTLSDVSVKSECESYEKYIEFARRLQTMIERL
jgi:hypothetical protein